jgi:hypothetical protein
LQNAKYRAKGVKWAAEPPPITLSVQLPANKVAAFKSAIHEIGEELAGRAEGVFGYPKEQAITDALVCIGIVRAQLTALGVDADPNY